LSVVGARRCIGVDEPNAITVDLACKTRLIRAELVNAKIPKNKSIFHSCLRNILGLGRNND